MDTYICELCGYFFDPDEGDQENGIKPGTSFKKLPDSWVCPDCGSSKIKFAPVENVDDEDADYDLEPDVFDDDDADYDYEDYDEDYDYDYDEEDYD